AVVGIVCRIGALDGDGVVTLGGINVIGSCGVGNGIGLIGCDEILDTRESVGIAAAGGLRGLQVERNTHGAGNKGERIGARAAIVAVGASLVVESVVSVAAGDGIVAGTGVNAIGTIAAVQRVGTRATGEGIVAEAAGDLVIGTIAGEDVVEIGTSDVFDA